MVEFIFLVRYRGFDGLETCRGMHVRNARAERKGFLL